MEMHRTKQNGNRRSGDCSFLPHDVVVDLHEGRGRVKPTEISIYCFPWASSKQTVPVMLPPKTHRITHTLEKYCQRIHVLCFLCHWFYLQKISQSVTERKVWEVNNTTCVRGWFSSCCRPWENYRSVWTDPTAGMFPEPWGRKTNTPL